MPAPVEAGTPRPWQQLLPLLRPLLTVGGALVAGAIPLLLLRVNPLAAYWSFLSGSLGNFYGMSEVVVKTIPLIFTGLAVALPLRAGLWNIGAEGQLYMGAFAASGVALAALSGNYPAWLLLPALTVMGALAGAVWGFIPGLLRARLGVSEIITTLMLNYLAILWADYLIYGPWRDPGGFNFPLTAVFPKAAWLPRYPGTRAHAGLILALLVAVLIYFIFTRTKLGFELKFVGANPQAAELGGISQAKLTLWVLAAGGALAALAGVGEVSAVQHRLRPGISPSYGYTGIAVALLGKSHPLGVILAAAFFGILAVGGSFLQQTKFPTLFGSGTVQVPVAIVEILQALVILFIIGGELLTRAKH
ncbi:MAG: ABC transporter permease [Deinococcus sp.]|nr:ABC transporter permease [Deinococcus sp.]